MVETCTGPTHIIAFYTDTAAQDCPVLLKIAAVFITALSTAATDCIPNTHLHQRGRELTAVQVALETTLSSGKLVSSELRVL